MDRWGKVSEVVLKTTNQKKGDDGGEFFCVDVNIKCIIIISITGC